MKHWSRRRFLSAMGSTGAAVTSGWLGACGPTARVRSADNASLIGDEELRRIVEKMDRPLGDAYIWSRRQRVTSLSIDSNQEFSDQRVSHWVVLGGSQAGVPRSIALLNPGTRELEMAAQQLGGEKRAKGLFTPPQRIEDLSRQGVHRIPFATGLRQQVLDLYQRSEVSQSSRILFRSAFLRIQETQHLLLSKRQHRLTRTTRSRSGVLVAAWTGAGITTAERGSSQIGMPSELPSTEQSLRDLAEDALAQNYARAGGDSGMTSVILSPDCAAQLIYQTIILPSCSSLAPTLKATQRVRIEDNPHAGYAGFSYDDLGDASSATVLLGDRRGSKLGKGSRRRDVDANLTCFPSRVVMSSANSSSTLSKDQLIASVSSGVLLEGPLHCTMEPQSQRLMLVAGRGREIRSGRLTGRVFSKQVMTVALPSLIADTQALSSSSTNYSSEVRGIPMSVDCPHWLSRAHLEPA